MKKFLAKALVIVLAAVMLLALVGCGEGTEEKFKVGVILLHDENSTYDLNFLNAVNRAKEEMGLEDDQVIIKRNIEEGNACYETACELAEKGCKVIFADSFGHEDYMIEAAKKYPDVQFCHATGTKAHSEGLSNYHNAFAAIYEGRYMAGVAAGMKLNTMKDDDGKINGETPKMGYVGAFTYAEVVSGYTSFYLGAKSVCDEVIMDVQFTGSWYDESEEKSAAQALIAAGCHLISQHADSMGAPTACEDAGIPNVSYNGSTLKGHENTFIISSAIDWTPYFKYIFTSGQEGTAIETDWVGTIETGSVVLSELNEAVAAEGTKAALDEIKAQFVAGTLHVFDTSKEGFITVGGQPVTSYEVEGTNVVANGYFDESSLYSAPYFNLRIDGITLLNEKY